MTQRPADLGTGPAEAPWPHRARDGADDASVIDDLFAHAYSELHDLARRQRRRWQGNHTLNTTALLHEAYVKLSAQDRVHLAGRAHFLALASKSMRHILCNHARSARAQKRGGGADMMTVEEAVAGTAALSSGADYADLLVALDDAMRRLEDIDGRQARVVECRFFGGLTVEETAAAIGISPRTVKRDWQVAQAWLQREMGRVR